MTPLSASPGFDFPAIVRASRRFYRDRGLLDWARAVPRCPMPAGDVEPTLAQAQRAGFDEAFAFPPHDLQMATLDRLVDACARRPSARLPDNVQYRDPFLADDWTSTPNGRVLQRADDLGVRRDGPYVLLLSTRPLANCWGKTGKQIGEQFDAKSWRGLTAPEYLVLQRVFAERYGDHRFLSAPEDPEAHWLWLIDTMTETSCTVAYGSARGINLQATNVNNRESKRAALAGVLVPLHG